MKELSVNLKNESYKIYIGFNILNNLPLYLEKVYKNKNVFIITDEKVASFYLDKVTNILKDKYHVESVVIKSGENSKSVNETIYIIHELILKGIKRNDLIISLGGGVISDIAGFVSSILYRGIPYINISTTLLSSIDASIGGKTGINFENHKNIIGSFKQPLLVLIDLAFFKTLPNDEIKNGIGEIIKYGAIASNELLEKLENGIDIDENIIYECLNIKKNYVEKDVYDQKERMLLNFGHTFGHVIELKDNIKHGMAVGQGMLMAINLGIDLKLTNPYCYAYIKKILEKYNLPTKYNDYHLYINDIFYDKKNISGVLNLILIKNLGEAFIYKFDKKCLENNESHN